MAQRLVRFVVRSNDIIWVKKNLLSRAPPCFESHVKPLVPAAFAVVSSHQPALGPRGVLWPVLLMCNPYGRPVPQKWQHS
jgi:hypothetical protein